jgi:predicted nucleic acid-binding protein
MKDKVFIDSNILVYAHTDVDSLKQRKAQQVISAHQSIISTQVLQECSNVLFKKFDHSWHDIETVMDDIISKNELFVNQESTIRLAIQVAELYKFSFYDSLIIAAALESECSILFSEDMSNGVTIKNQLLITNPLLDLNT